MKHLEIKNITLKQTPETDEALKLLYDAKRGVKLTFLIVGFVIGILAICCRKDVILCAAFITLLVLIPVAYLFLSYFLFRDYYALLSIARRNDEIRHEERIRFRERKRLEEIYQNEIVVTKREEKEINKTREKEIAKAEELENQDKLPQLSESTYVVEDKKIAEPKQMASALNRPSIPLVRPK